ncbi:MAG TPA: hypothetical protein VH598_14860, partial [Verrucomicrobiae bacterium]|nr:hypothetical protein [Verrucomicrobiae bacterium]
MKFPDSALRTPHSPLFPAGRGENSPNHSRIDPLNLFAPKGQPHTSPLITAVKFFICVSSDGGLRKSN